MKRIVFALVGVGAIAGAVAITLPSPDNRTARLRRSTGSNSPKDIVTGA